MTVFLSTINQMAFLFSLIIVGYILSRFKFVSDGCEGILSKLENAVFIPALILDTFMQNFTLERITSASQFVLFGLIFGAVNIPIALAISKLLTKDGYIRNIYAYGLAFSNFGFMGNAVVKAMFPNIFMEYLMFVIPLWFFIYVWAVPSLLTPSDERRKSIKQRLMTLVNPMFISLAVGAIIGLSNIQMPDFINTTCSTLGNCMSPIAMLLTGMTIAKIDLLKTLKNLSIYAITFIRLLAFPIVAIVVLAFVKIPHTIALCALCSVAMPFGLNTIVIPVAYNKDASVAAGLALTSHLLSCLTIPFVFMLFDIFVHSI